MISPAIIIFRTVHDAICAQFTALLGRGTRHGTPSKDTDVLRLTVMYLGSHVHRHEAGCVFKHSVNDLAKDFISIGADKLIGEGVIEKWWNERNFERSQDEIYSLDEYRSSQMDIDEPNSL